MRSFREIYPPPWTAERMPGGYAVKASNGFTLVRIYAHSEEELKSTSTWDKLTWAHAHTLAKAICLLGNWRS